MHSKSNKNPKQKIKIGIVAGEKSGDELGSSLMHSLKKIFPLIDFIGIGGEKMKEAGLVSLFEMERISVMGITEPLMKIFELLALRKQLKIFFSEQKPDIFVGIDSPDFNLPLSRYLKQKQKIKTVQYVGPSIWAWREGRIKRIEQSVDKVLTLFPFESEAYKGSLVDVSFVGHPLAHRFSENLNKTKLKAEKFPLCEKKMVALLPGSRKSEILKMSGVFMEAAKLIRDSDSSASFYMPLTNIKFKKLIRDIKKFKWINFSEGDSQEVLAAADIGIVTSGTASLEAALLRTPVVVAYKTSWLTYLLVKPLLKIQQYALPNLLAGKKVLPELIQGKVTAANLFEAFKTLEKQSYQNTLKTFEKIHLELRAKGPNTAAKAIAELI